MEELEKKLQEILIDAYAHGSEVSDMISDEFELCELRNHSIAELIVFAYKQGVDRYFLPYVEAQSTIDRVKTKLLNDYIK